MMEGCGPKSFYPDYVCPDNIDMIYNNPGAEGVILREKNREQIATLARLVKKPEPDEKLKILDVGCSHGEGTLGLAKNLSTAGYPANHFDVIGIDARRGAIARAEMKKKGSNAANVSFRIHDLFKGHFDGKFHIIYCNHVLKAIDPRLRQKVLTNIIESLVPGGIITFENMPMPMDPYEFASDTIESEEAARAWELYDLIEELPKFGLIKLPIDPPNGRYFQYFPPQKTNENPLAISHD
jgi:2-polyprenyl-3-methyl-5-hydroxy-6-metoxy-1,4-benzoquinol methylase